MKKFLTGFAAAGMLFGALSASHALTQFAFLNPIPSPPGPQTPYCWENDEAGTTGQLVLTDTNLVKPGIQLDVTFQFLQAVPVIGTNVVDAELTMSAESNGTMLGTAQPLKNLVFEVTPKNAGDVFGAGILLRTVVPSPVDFPDGTLATLQSIADLGFLGSSAIQGLIMESSYILIDPNENQTATWSYSLLDPPGAFAPDPGNMILRDTKLGGNANFSATVFNVVPEPGSVAMLLSLGVGGSLALIRRRRTR